MPFREIETQTPSPRVINAIIPETPLEDLSVVTTNERKLGDMREVLGPKVHPVKLGKIREIQPDKPDEEIEVTEAKAIAAYEANGGKPVMVEETSVQIEALGRWPGPLVAQQTATREQREDICATVSRKGDNRARAIVTLGIFDGKNFHYRQGITTGTIANHPAGNGGPDGVFGWDDIFQPNGQELLPCWDGKRRTLAELMDINPLFKTDPWISMRTKALLALRSEPFDLTWRVYELPEPYQIQFDAIDRSLLSDPTVRQHAWDLEALAGNSPREDFQVDKFPPYYEESIGGEGSGVKRYCVKDSPSLGIIITPFDRPRDLHREPYRLQLDASDRPIFWQMGPGAVERALAARALEFELHHNPEMYAYVRALRDGDIKIEPRSNTRSPAIESLLEMIGSGEGSQEIGFDQAFATLATASTQELGYARAFSEKEMHRTAKAIQGLMVVRGGIPCSVFGLGAMPPVTGWTDVLATSALSFMDSFIPRNSIYAGNPELQFKLFHAAEGRILALNLPDDITEMVLAHIGIAFGIENPKEVEEMAKRAYKEGIRLIRLYTTSTDIRSVQAAEAVRVGAPHEDMRLYYSMLVDIDQAKRLIGPNIAANAIIAGHGAGENCSSLIGGGAANALELIYQMSLLPEFNGTAIGLEGGTSTQMGAILPIADGIFLNRRGVAGGIELGGLFVEHVNGRAVQPYHGSASPIPQWVEALVSEEIRRRRLDRAGRVLNVEGVPNYFEKERSVNSATDNWAALRKLAGTTLADQGAESITDLRRIIREKRGFSGHRKVTFTAASVAAPHPKIKSPR